MVLVTGFGPFLDVRFNPSSRLALAVDGRRVAGETIVSRVLPVSYARAPAEVARVAAILRPRLVLGLGVARGRERVAVEARGRRLCGANADVDGVILPHLGDGPDEVAATIDVDALARALDADVSHDAGGYVCNAWLYRVASAIAAPVGFVHLPAEGMAPERLTKGIEALLTR